MKSIFALFVCTLWCFAVVARPLGDRVTDDDQKSAILYNLQRSMTLTASEFKCEGGAQLSVGRGISIEKDQSKVHVYLQFSLETVEVYVEPGPEPLIVVENYFRRDRMIPFKSIGVTQDGDIKNKAYFTTTSDHKQVKRIVFESIQWKEHLVGEKSELVAEPLADFIMDCSHP